MIKTEDLALHFRNGYIQDKVFAGLEPDLTVDTLAEALFVTRVTPPGQFISYIERHGDIRCYRFFIDQIRRELDEAERLSQARHAGHTSAPDNILKCKKVLVNLFKIVRQDLSAEDISRLRQLPQSYPVQKSRNETQVDRFNRPVAQSMVVFWTRDGSMAELHELVAAQSGDAQF